MRVEVRFTHNTLEIFECDMWCAGEGCYDLLGKDKELIQSFPMWNIYSIRTITEDE